MLFSETSVNLIIFITAKHVYIEKRERTAVMCPTSGLFGDHVFTSSYLRKLVICDKRWSNHVFISSYQ